MPTSSAAAGPDWARLAIDPLKSDATLTIVPGKMRYGNRRDLGLFGLCRTNLKHDLALPDIAQRSPRDLVQEIGIDGLRPEQRHPRVPRGALGRDLGKLVLEAGHLGLDGSLVGEAPGPVEAVPAEVAEEAEGSHGDGNVEGPEPHVPPFPHPACDGEHGAAMVNQFISGVGLLNGDSGLPILGRLEKGAADAVVVEIRRGAPYPDRAGASPRRWSGVIEDDCRQRRHQSGGDPTADDCARGGGAREADGRTTWRVRARPRAAGDLAGLHLPGGRGQGPVQAARTAGRRPLPGREMHPGGHLAAARKRPTGPDPGALADQSRRNRDPRRRLTPATDRRKS